MKRTTVTNAHAGGGCLKETKTLHNYFGTASGRKNAKVGLSVVKKHSMSNQRCSSNTTVLGGEIDGCSKQEMTMTHYFPAAPVVKKRKITWEKYFENQMNSLALYQAPIKRQYADESSQMQRCLLSLLHTS